MEKPNVVGYRFSPTGEELINYYLKNKILGKSWLVDEAVMEINICDFRPESLPPLSKIKSKDLVWYFFSPREFLPTKKKVTKRTTSSGFWKPTGKDRIIKDKRGKIGSKKTLVYYEGKAAKGVRTPWVMHEYHITSLPLVVESTYVICKVMYKGDEDSLNGNNSNELSHSMVIDSIDTPPEVGQLDQQDNNRLSLDARLTPTNEQEGLSQFHTDMVFSNNNNPHVQPQSPGDDEFFSELLDIINGGNLEYVFPNPETIMEERRNDHMPKKPSTWTIPDYSDSDDSSSETDAESISATSYQGISSPGDSDGSSSRPFHTSVDEIPLLRKDSCKDVQASAETSINRKTWKSLFTRRTIQSKQEVKEAKSKAVDASMDKNSSSSMVKTEKFITEEAMRRNRKNPRYIYLMKMIIDFFISVGGSCH